MRWIDSVLEGRAVLWFLGLVIAYLGYQIALNAMYFGTHWWCWDYMLISGFVAFIVAILLARSIRQRLDRAIDQLRLNNALILTEDGVQHIKHLMAVRGKAVQAWSALLIGSLIFGSYLWVFGGFALRVYDAWHHGQLPGGVETLFELAVFTGLSALCAALAGLFFGRLAHYGTLADVLSTEEAQLRIAPGHFDGAAGLKPIGDFYLYQALLLAIPILWLGAWWAWIIPTYKGVVCSVTGQPQFFFSEWQGPYFVMWLVVLAYFYSAFIRPFMTLRRRLRATRIDLNLHDAKQIEEDIFRLQATAVARDRRGRDALAIEIEALSRRLWSIRNMWDWPMDAATLAKYRSLVFAEVLFPLIASTLTSSNGNMGSSYLLKWLF
jgi:hypothetical protein